MRLRKKIQKNYKKKLHRKMTKEKVKRLFLQFFIQYLFDGYCRVVIKWVMDDPMGLFFSMGPKPEQVKHKTKLAMFLGIYFFHFDFMLNVYHI